MKFKAARRNTESGVVFVSYLILLVGVGVALIPSFIEFQTAMDRFACLKIFDNQGGEGVFNLNAIWENNQCWAQNTQTPDDWDALF